MAGMTAWIIFSCLSVVAAALNTVLNVDEIDSIHYAVDIINKPVIKEQVWDGEVMTIVNKHGHEYVCSLPRVTPLDSDFKHDDDILDQLVDISVLLRPMETAPCLIKTVDWWTYEFCYSSVIKQYHLEDSKASGPIIILGKYESEYNWKNSSETKNRLQRFHSQFYVNGTKCDLTGEPRRTEVRFHCEDGVGDYIQRVDEPESCRYVVTVATTRVCHHPYLRLQSVRTPHAITCAPVLTQEQYHRYLTYQEEKNRQDQVMKEMWLKQNVEVLRGTDSEENQSILHPITANSAYQDDDDEEELKMKIKIFRLSPVKKQKNQQPAEDEDVKEVETQTALEESGTDEAARSGEGTEDVDDEVAGGTNEQEKKRRKEENILDVNTEDVGTEDEESLISNLQAKELLQFLDVSEDYTDTTGVTSTDEESMSVEEKSEESYLTEEDELDDDDDDDEDDEEEAEVEEKEAMRQTSKSTKRDHFSKLQRRLRQLAKMFMDQETDGVKEGEEDKIAELLKMVDSLRDGYIKQLEQEVKEWTNKLLSKTKKEMETLEEFLDHQLKEMEDLASQEGESSGTEKSTQSEMVNTDSQDLIEAPQDPEEDTSSKTSKKNADKGAGSIRDIRMMKNRMEDEFQTEIEQTIKDRLRKLGLENIGRKFELKILTPDSLDDEDTNNPLLSQEETEAFKNVIVDLLSANAEELEEKKNHKKLEKNYSFRWDESELDEDE